MSEAGGSQEAIVVGAGPAGLAAAEALATSGRRVAIYDAAPSPARKFLMAGRGGLNLTHSEPLNELLARYGTAAEGLTGAIERFSPMDLRAWAAELGEPTFVGSSGRIFPKSFKATPLLRAWLARLAGLGVTMKTRRRLIGLADGGRTLRFRTPEGEEETHAAAVVLAFGGASWPRLGGDGAWVAALREAGVEVAPLKPANCGFRVTWSEHLRARFSGTPLKAIALSFAGATTRGEAMIDAEGIEGGAVYALSALLRDAIARDGKATLAIDLKPDLSEAALAARLIRPPGQSASTFLRKAAGLAPVAIALTHEAGPLPDQPEALAARIKRVELRLTAPAPIARAISSAGGVLWREIDERFMLRKLPGVFVAGEMIDWEAPTGGYLLQACFATGRAAGEGAAEWLARSPAK
ncbi:MAG: TIGR03862 family flavoprotein [Bradyrhizobium sp.]|nr:MAG: TIGR03862 family flavoprotein [Bradyrhizobium sp.]